MVANVAPLSLAPKVAVTAVPVPIWKTSFWPLVSPVRSASVVEEVDCVAAVRPVVEKVLLVRVESAPIVCVPVIFE